MIRAHIAGRKQPNTWFGRLIQFILIAAVLTLGLMFSIVVIPTVIFLGLIIWGYIWWKTRSLREQLKAAAEQSGQHHESTSTTSNSQNDDLIIEGEATRVDSDKPV